MRIITGKYRAKRLHTIREQDLRPTSNKNKEVIFNVLSHGNSEYLRDNLSDYNCFLDVFCGTAAMAFEALSRGIEKVMLIDINSDLVELAKYNAEEFAVSEKVNAMRLDALKLPKSYSKSDLCFIDPPYNRDLISGALVSLDKQGWLSDNAIVIIEASEREKIVFPDNYEVFNERSSGKIKIIFCCYKPSSE